MWEHGMPGCAWEAWANLSRWAETRGGRDPAEVLGGITSWDGSDEDGSDEDDPGGDDLGGGGAGGPAAFPGGRAALLKRRLPSGRLARWSLGAPAGVPCA